MLIKNDTIIVVVLVVMLLAISLSVFRSCSVGAGEDRVIRATVTDKGIKRIHDKDTYLIFTDTGVFQITDSLIAGRFNSADIYAGIKIGITYDFTVRGDRSELMSWYPNIYEFKEVSE